MSPAPSVGEAIVDGTYTAGWALVRRMPERAAYALFERIADITWSRRGRQVSRLESNLRRVTGQDDVRSLSRDGMRRYLRYWCDAFRLPGWSRERIVSTFVCHNEHLLADGLAAGNGVMIALPHMGNWDHAGAWACVEHATVVTVAERLRPEKVYEKFLDFRRDLGMEVLPLTGGDPPFRTLLRRLRAGGLVCLLGDRDLTDGGIPVEFFGSTAKFPAGPAALAVRTGATLIAATLWNADGCNHTHLHAVDTSSRDISAITQAIATVFEKGVRERPADWHMLSRLWVEDLA